MVRVAHLADTHLGYRHGFWLAPDGRNQRMVDFDLAWFATVARIVDAKPDLVIHAGDVFHTPRPGWDALRAFISGMQSIVDAGIPAVVIAGNHDTPRLRQHTRLFQVLGEALPSVRFADLNMLVCVPLPGVVVHCVPHAALGEPLVVFPRPGNINVLVAHGFVENVAIDGGLREIGEAVLPSGLLEPGLDYVALGHYHVHHQVRPNAWFSGATERCGFGDELVEPGFVLATIEPGREPVVEHVAVLARPMRTLAGFDAKRGEPDAVVERIAGMLRTQDQDGALLRIRVVNPPASARYLEGRLDAESAAGGFLLRIEAIRGRETPAAVPNLARGEKPRIELSALFAEFVAGTRHDETFKTAFLARGQRALADAQEAARNAVVED